VFQDEFGIAQYGGGVGLGLAVGRGTCFELAAEDESGQTQIAGEKDLGQPTAYEHHETDTIPYDLKELKRFERRTSPAVEQQFRLES
jgi:hypothetical protein